MYGFQPYNYRIASLHIDFNCRQSPFAGSQPLSLPICRITTVDSEDTLDTQIIDTLILAQQMTVATAARRAVNTTQTKRFTTCQKKN